MFSYEEKDGCELRSVIRRAFEVEASGVGEAEILALAADDVIKHADTEDLPGLHKALRAFAVFTRRRGIPGDMIVQEDNRSRAVQQGSLEDLARMDQRGGQSADRDCVKSDQPVLAVERDYVGFRTMSRDASALLAVRVRHKKFSM